MMFTSFFFQAEDGIRDLVRSRGLGDVYKRQILHRVQHRAIERMDDAACIEGGREIFQRPRGDRALKHGIELSLIHI